MELREPVWQAWLLRFGTLSLLADGSVLLAYGSAPRAVYSALAVSVVAVASLRRVAIPERVTVATWRCLMGTERVMPAQRKRM